MAKTDRLPSEDDLAYHQRLDRLAAEVMGWHESPCPEGGCSRWLDSQDRWAELVYRFQPTRDISQAWLVQSHGAEKYGAKFRVSFVHLLQLESPVATIEWNWWYATAPPLARVIAAIKATEKT